MGKLDVNDKNVFDKWREMYYELTDQEQIQFYNDLEGKYPHQQGFTLEAYQNFFKELNHPVSVCEIGGWKGELSDKLMNDYFGKIVNWVNIELCENAVKKSVNTRDTYRAITPNNFRWFYHNQESPLSTGYYDVFIASHVIEHLTDADFLCLVRYIKKQNPKYIIFEAPIRRTINYWKGYLGTHILGMGWDIIENFMDEMGFESKLLQQDVYLFTKRDL